MLTLSEWSQHAAARLVSAGFPADDARQDVAVLARHVLGLDMAGWILHQAQPLNAGQTAALDALVNRRQRHEPVAYLTGEREFFGRPFHVAPGVLTPRPETELLVEVALKHVRERARSTSSPPRLLDVGTGSGCLAITLALEVRTAIVTATDTSGAALAIARENARRLAIGDRVTWVETSLTKDWAGAFDGIVSNPPYVALADRDRLALDVRDFEPATALFGGADGLDVIRALVPAAWRALVPGGWLAMEIGAGQAGDVMACCQQAGFEHIEVRHDLAGHARVIVATRPSGSI